MASASTTVSTTVLKSVPMFGSFPEAQLRALATMVTRRSVSRGSTIMHAGDPTDSLYIVVSGRLKVMMGEADGKEVILGLIGPGEFFGEMGLVDDSPRSATVVAIEPCELLAVTKRVFKKCLVENVEVALAVLRVVVQRLREADRKIGSLAMLDVYGRVARLLLDMSENVNGQKVVTKRLTKQDIARMVGASREMVSKVMKDLETSGYFEVRGSTIVLRDTMPVPR
ncbi:MAG TPA: cyclic nucleotide-binding domain-containing protein [Burkholderiales bacterium]|nr:cyclic nucleotide-binding domain-containing protein [Burkholderiales bacterium]